MFPDFPSLFLKHFGITKWINTGFYVLKNPEIMKMSSFDAWNNEIGILLYQSEAGKSIKLLNLFLNKIIIFVAPHRTFHGVHVSPKKVVRCRGCESKCWGMLVVPLLENRKVTKFSFHVFDRYEIHLQVFGDFISAFYMFIIFRSSSSENYVKNR